MTHSPAAAEAPGFDGLVGALEASQKDASILMDQLATVVRSLVKNVEHERDRGRDNNEEIEASSLVLFETRDDLASSQEVLEAKLGAIDDRLGEAVGVAIFLADGASLTQDELAAFLGPKISKFKIPEHVWFRDEPLPQNANGKFVKRQLRDELAPS